MSPFPSGSVLQSLLYCGVGLLTVTALGRPARAEPAVPLFRFTFGPGTAATGWTQVLAETTYSADRGYGFEPGSQVTGVDRGGADPLHSHFVTSDHSFFFSVTLPEGNYNIAVTLGDSAGASTTTVKAEDRRLMLEKVHTEPGQFQTRTFTVNLRRPGIAGGGRVHLKTREMGALDWDDKLTLEFSNERPCLCSLEITRADDAITVYLAGDSTVTDQPLGPWNSWGQMLPRFFKPGVAIANHAESGDSLGSFLGEKRLDKIMSIIKPGDYLFIQMGHNDQKDKAPGAGPYTTYTDRLKLFVARARQHGALPVLITPMHRRRFDHDGHVVNTLGDFPDAMRRVAAEEKVPLIDLNAMSKILYEAWGPVNSKKGFQDGTHHNNYGSYELAKCVVDGIRQDKLGLARFIVDDLPAFDPAHPDSPDDFHIPASPHTTSVKPEGN